MVLALATLAKYRASAEVLPIMFMMLDEQLFQFIWNFCCRAMLQDSCRARTTQPGTV